jgi:hypothetical protein
MWEDLNRRVAALLDVEAIEALKARYWRAVDRGRADDVRECLLPEALIDFDGLPRFEGRNGFVAVVRESAARAGAYHMHHGHNPDIELTGPDSAVGVWEVFYHGIDLAARTIVHMAGAYNDTYRRRDGHWWIATTTMRQTSLTVQQVDMDSQCRYVSGV